MTWGQFLQYARGATRDRAGHARAYFDEVCGPLPSPSPRSPLGRSRPSSTCYGEGRDEGAFHRFGQAESLLTPTLSIGRRKTGVNALMASGEREQRDRVQPLLFL